MYRIGMVGTGGMSSLHTGSLKKLGNVQVAAVCSRMMKSAEEFAEKHGMAAYDDFGEMIEKEALHAVFICIPPYAHADEVEKAAAKGIHVFLEKPIALTMERAQSMVNAVKQYHVKTQVGYHCRFGGAVKELKRRIENGEAGRPVLFTGKYECNSLHSTWWRDHTKSGSQVLEQAIHTYDMSAYLFGPPQTVCGFMDNLCHKNHADYTVEDVSASVIRYANGALGSITATNCAVPGQWKNPFSVVFENLTVHFQNPNTAVFINTAKEPAEKQSVACGEDMYFEEVKAFISELDGKSPAACPIEEGLLSLALVSKVMESAANNGMPEQLKGE